MSAEPTPLDESGPRLDEWTEAAIREVLNAGLKHGPKDKLNPPTDCPLCSLPIAALRSRIRELVEEARIDERRRPLFWERTRKCMEGS